MNVNIKSCHALAHGLYIYHWIHTAAATATFWLHTPHADEVAGDFWDPVSIP